MQNKLFDIPDSPQKKYNCRYCRGPEKRKSVGWDDERKCFVCSICGRVDLSGRGIKNENLFKK